MDLALRYTAFTVYTVYTLNNSIYPDIYRVSQKNALSESSSCKESQNARVSVQPFLTRGRLQDGDSESAFLGHSVYC